MKKINDFKKENLSEIIGCKYLYVEIIIWNDKIYFITKFNRKDMLDVDANYHVTPLYAEIKFVDSIMEIYFNDLYLDFNKISVDLVTLDYSSYFMRQKDIEILFFDESENMLFSKEILIRWDINAHK
ncbi:MAG: hypothetical protein ACOCRX_09505 [Candidatus Woesearchaeota archaeon]